MKLIFATILPFLLGFAIPVTSFEVKCGTETISVKPEQMLGFMECLQVVGIDKIQDISFSKIGCLAKCMLEKEGLIDGDGKPHKENIMNAMDKHLPPALAEPWKIVVEQCLASEAHKIKKDDPKCQSYMPLIMCVANSYRRICK